WLKFIAGAAPKSPNIDPMAAHSTAGLHFGRKRWKGAERRSWPKTRARTNFNVTLLPSGWRSGLMATQFAQILSLDFDTWVMTELLSCRLRFGRQLAPDKLSGSRCIHSPVKTELDWRAKT